MANPTADFPNSVHTSVDVSVYTASGLGVTSTTHTQLEGKQESEMVAVQTKVGAGSGVVASSGAFLMGIAPGSTGWISSPLSSWMNFDSIQIRGSGLSIKASGSSNTIAFLDNNGNLFISGNYLTL